MRRSFEQKLRAAWLKRIRVFFAILSKYWDQWQQGTVETQNKQI
jgi:hypothetical protein